MKRSPELLQERNDAIITDFYNMQDQGMLVDDILVQLKKKYYLEKGTLYQIVYNKKYSNRNNNQTQ